MSKIVMFLALLAIGQVALALPAIENVEEYDISSSEEERISLGEITDWIKEKASALKEKAKEAFLGAGGKALLEKGLALIQKLGVETTPLTCTNNLCSACININVPPVNGKSACLEFGVKDKSSIAVSVSWDGKEYFARSLSLKDSAAICADLPFPIGSVCLQGVELKGDSEETGFCMIAAVKQFNIGGQFCANYKDGKLVPSMKQVSIPVTEQDNQLFKMEDDEIKSVEA